jgi:entericidin B
MINITSRVAAAIVLVLALASCGNTIRGFGKDASNTVDATEDAARDATN